MLTLQRVPTPTAAQPYTQFVVTSSQLPLQVPKRHGIPALVAPGMPIGIPKSLVPHPSCPTPGNHLLIQGSPRAPGVVQGHRKRVAYYRLDYYPMGNPFTNPPALSSGRAREPTPRSP